MNFSTMKKTTKMICLSLVMALVFSVLTPAAVMETQAARKVTANYNYKKAPAVKVGTTVVTAKPYNAKNNSTKNKTSVPWVKFTATKTGTYQITFSNYVCKQKPDNILFSAVNAMTGKSEGKYPGSYFKVKTQGGKTSTLWMCAPSSYSKTGSVTTGTSLPTRTATVKLKKGQVVYFSFNNGKTATCTVKIKKK